MRLKGLFSGYWEWSYGGRSDGEASCGRGCNGQREGPHELDRGRSTVRDLDKSMGLPTLLLAPLTLQVLEQVLLWHFSCHRRWMAQYLFPCRPAHGDYSSSTPPCGEWQATYSSRTHVTAVAPRRALQQRRGDRPGAVAAFGTQAPPPPTATAAGVAAPAPRAPLLRPAVQVPRCARGGQSTYPSPAAAATVFRRLGEGDPERTPRRRGHRHLRTDA